MEVSAEFVERYVTPNKRQNWPAEDRPFTECELASVYGSRRISEIMGRDVTKILDEFATRSAPVRANRTLAAAPGAFIFDGREY